MTHSRHSAQQLFSGLMLFALACFGFTSASAAVSVKAAAPANPFKDVAAMMATDSLDSRGDINYNHISYEIADYVLFSQYFLQGPSVFTVSPADQDSASDVNNDGLTGRIGDLVYLGRVIDGLSSAFPKQIPGNQLAVVHLYRSHDTLGLTTTVPVGALYLVFNGDVQPTLLPSGSYLQFHFDGAQTHVLILDTVFTLPTHLNPGPVLYLAGLTLPEVAQSSDTGGADLQTFIDTQTGCCINQTGNVNANGLVDIADLSALVLYLSGGGYILPCVTEADINASGAINLADLSSLVSYLTGGGFTLPSCP